MNPDFTVSPGWMPEFGIPGSPLELNVIAFQTGECVFFAACRERWVSFLSFVPIGEAKWTERSRPLSSRHFGACREADKIQEFAGKRIFSRLQSAAMTPFYSRFGERNACHSPENVTLSGPTR